jgi:hypothetical protein
MTPRDTVEALNFLVVPLGDLVLFLGFLVAALYFRRQPKMHQRLMIFAMVGGIIPGLGIRKFTRQNSLGL